MHPIGIFDGGNDPLASKDARWRRFLSCRSRHDCPNGFHSRRSLLSQFVHTHTQHFLPFHWSLVDRFAPTQCLSGSIQHVSLQAIVRLLLRPLQSTPSFRQSRQVVRPTRNTSCASHRGRRVHPFAVTPRFSPCQPAVCLSEGSATARTHLHSRVAAWLRRLQACLVQDASWEEWETRSSFPFLAASAKLRCARGSSRRSKVALGRGGEQRKRKKEEFLLGREDATRLGWCIKRGRCVDVSVTNAFEGSVRDVFEEAVGSWEASLVHSRPHETSWMGEAKNVTIGSKGNDAFLQSKRDASSCLHIHRERFSMRATCIHVGVRATVGNGRK
mmetsp:Transcript_2088/g.13465  ORF Transcript_2088/g.13465 Transcript_2088/m.13465 type:complete len:330 (-) Transcript_2088:4103-5092(-)